MSKKFLIIGGILIAISGLYFWASKKIDEYKTFNARNTYLESYAGCEIKRFNLAVTEPDPKYPTLTVGVDNVNKYWKQDSQEWHFDHADVVAYMMKHCPPKSDTDIESLYSYLLDGTDRYPDMDERQEGLKWIKIEKSIRDYQLKFINKNLDIFRE